MELFMFILGFIIGTFTGVFIMALLQVNRNIEKN